MSEVLVTVETEYLQEEVPQLQVLEIGGTSEVLEIGGSADLIEVVVAPSEQLIELAAELLQEQTEVLELLETAPVAVELLEVAEQGPVGPPGATGATGATGPAGPAGDAPPAEPTFSYSAGKLVGVAYADGSTKTLAYTGDVLTRIDSLRTGFPGVRKDLTYNPDGTLAAVAQSAI